MTYPQTKNYLALKIVSYSTADVFQRTQLSYAIILNFIPAVLLCVTVAPLTLINQFHFTEIQTHPT
ncbi:hypothetical protein RIR_e52924_A0A2N1NDF6_9GLOM [Rhizophagus irregularis DAOM 181602=DAOM 197198]|uniref:Uncharacterized protein n=1 Tax=Rhizophagus irregularis TaxID=588596 RepID=A0A2N1NDF6_9GLOM|nr:hypothetical protein RhiirC2_743661 [Rhizophagus irregularis]GET50119.1 hypothetical protein RIR_e52924_A0A2N1NDF6_9GLOM [Rhizophagus irregularis DAOM 181602=DAOM 197198]